MAENDKSNTSNANEDDSGVFKGISLTPALTTLFKPTTELVGKEIKLYVKEKIENWKQKKRADNVHGHVEKVKENLNSKNQNNDISTITQMDLFEDWVDGAQDVDPNEEILSNIWQEILLRIASGNTPNKILLDKLKSLEIDEAKTLLKLSEQRLSIARSSKEKYFYETLSKKGLVEKDNRFLVLIGITSIWLLVMLVLVFFSSIFVKMEFLPLDPYITVYGFFILLVVSSFYFFLSYIKGFSRWRLSWIGKELVEYAKRS